MPGKTASSHYGDMTVKRIPLHDLRQDPNNARTHNDKNLGAIKASLAEFGQVEPLVVRQATMQIIGGNGRYDAMKALGWRDAECVLLDIDERRATLLGIELNRSAELAAWDKDTLILQVQQLQEGGEFDLAGMALGADDMIGLGCEVPDFTASEETPPRLDEKKQISCPECGHTFSA